MMTLAAIAFNTNLTEEQCRDLMQAHIDAKDKAYSQVAVALKDMTPECALGYLQAVLPILISW